MTSKTIGAAQDDKRTIIVNGYAMPNITAEELDRWADDLTYVSCFSYGYTMEGELIEPDDDRLIQLAYESGVAPLMVLTPVDASGTYSYDLVRVLFTEPVIRDRLINNIFLKVTEERYLGMVFNLGYVAAEDSDQFLVTVSKTAARLNRSGYLVIVSITPGIDDEGIDYASLGRAANFLELRTFYREQVYGLPENITSVDRTREMLSRMITLVDSRSILLGLTNYGYDWTMPATQANPARIIPHVEAEELAGRMGVEIEYDEEVQAPHFGYRNPAGSTHVVWYENARSIRVKLEMVYDFNLGGIGIWTVMNPFPALKEALNDMFTVFKI